MSDGGESGHRLEDAERRGVYRAIYERRDVGSLFTQEPVSDEILARLLDAAHHAPSVGLMQPWRFIVVRDVSVRRAAHEAFTRASRLAAGIYDEERRALYRSMKLAGILDSPVNLCVVCDPTTERGHGLGRQTMPETCSYSTVCAVQNLWIAARAEGIGVGWVSILNVEELRALFNIPPHVVPVAYLCIGHVSRFEQQPELMSKGWERRAPLSTLIHFDRYGAADERRATELLGSLHEQAQGQRQ